MTSTATLLEALAAWLRDDLQPELAGVRAFENRIAVNLLATLRRELELAPALAHCDTSMAVEQGLAPELIPAALARALRDGHRSADAQLIKALRQRAMLRCAIDVPRYPGLAQARQRWPALADTVDAAIAASLPDAAGAQGAASGPESDAAMGSRQQHGDKP